MASTMAHRTVSVDGAAVRIDQHLRVPQAEIGTDAAGPACIFARVDVTRGRLAYLQGAGRVLAPARFAIYLPPFTVVQAFLEECEVATSGLAFRPPPHPDLPRDPVLIAFDEEDVPASPAAAVRLVRQADERVNIARCREPSRLAGRAKSILDAEYGTALAIGTVAARLRAPTAVLSRVFKAAYGLPPVRYRHHVRIMDALLRFADGALPVTVAQDVGFDDLSRFYKILRQVACAPPGTYRPSRSRNAKT